MSTVVIFGSGFCCGGLNSTGIDRGATSSKMSRKSRELLGGSDIEFSSDP